MIVPQRAACYDENSIFLFRRRCSINTHPGSKFLQLPATRLGWWAVGIAVFNVLMSIINSAVLMRLSEEVPWRQTVLPFYGILMMLVGITAGVVGLIAFLHNHERSWMILLTLVVGLNALVFIIGEFLFPH